ncbi:MAG: hypothetical protein ACR2JW_09770, partial [Thermomicrobiales bacterium]
MRTSIGSDQPMHAGVSRRVFLRGVAAAGATSALGALLAACGSSSATDTPKAAAATTAPAAATTAP